MSQEEFDREMSAIISELSYMENILQEEEMKNNQRRGWSMKKLIQWLVV